MLSSTQMVKEPQAPDKVRHFPELDGIRGIAILMVLFAHGVVFLGIVPPQGTPEFSLWGRLADEIFIQGGGGVDIFFALSGFLITGILLRSRNRATYFSSFYARRVLRIFPIYYLVLVLMVFSAHFSGKIRGIIPPKMARVPYFMYLQNWPWFWNSWAGLTSAWGVYWSLAVEEQFYFVWPALIRFFNRRLMLAVCLVGFGLGWCVRFLLIVKHGLLFGVMQTPFTRLDGLFVGGAIALYRDITKRPVSLLWSVVLMISGIGLLIVVICCYPSNELMGAGRHIWAFGPTAFALMAGGLIGASHFRPPMLHRVLTTRPLLLAGKLSYGMYVYHLVFFFAFAHLLLKVVRPRIGVGYSIPFAIAYLALALGIVTMVSYISYRYFETPFLRLKRHFPSAAAPV